MDITVSLVLTINNRSPEVSAKVADSFMLPGNRIDEAVVVLDRPTESARKGAFAAWANKPWPVEFVEIEGPQGWICPARAWNAAYDKAKSTHLYQISSEVVQDAGNVDKAREFCGEGNSVVFGACHNSEAEVLVSGGEPGLLASSRMPRPLGFIVCYPRSNMVAIGGNDLEFMNGLWFEDDDLFVRMWRTGINFVFDDSIHGVHLHHDRPGLATPEGQMKINRNAQLMLRKYGTTTPWQNTIRRVSILPGRTVWEHV